MIDFYLSLDPAFFIFLFIHISLPRSLRHPPQYGFNTLLYHHRPNTGLIDTTSRLSLLLFTLFIIVCIITWAEANLPAELACVALGS
jgi:hypothetical protein